MNFISLNLNGASDPRKGVWVRNLKWRLKADFLGLQESHQGGVSVYDAAKFWDKSNFNFAAVDSVGRSVGLISIWNPDVLSIDVISKNQRFLLTLGFMVGESDRINIVNTHAPNDPASRRTLWAELASLLDQFEGFWILFGDFNDVRADSERVNSKFDRAASEAFNGFIDSAGLLEFSMSGGMFTYISGHYEVKLVD